MVGLALHVFLVLKPVTDTNDVFREFELELAEERSVRVSVYSLTPVDMRVPGTRRFWPPCSRSRQGNRRGDVAQVVVDLATCS